MQFLNEVVLGWNLTPVIKHNLQNQTASIAVEVKSNVKNALEGILIGATIMAFFALAPEETVWMASSWMIQSFELAVSHLKTNACGWSEGNSIS